MISFLGFSWVSVNHLQWCQRKWVVLTFLIFIYFFNKLLLFSWFARWKPGTVGNWQNATCVNLKLLSFLLYKLRTSWLHQHLFFYPGGKYELLTTFPCSSLLFIKRKNLEIIVGDIKLLSYGLLSVSFDKTSLLRTAGFSKSMWSDKGSQGKGEKQKRGS